MTVKRTLLVALVVLAAWPAGSTAEAPIARAAATCADYAPQAEAQQAADTRDPDGDGIYCESLPCPCSTAAGGVQGNDDPPAPNSDIDASCVKPSAVQRIVFSAAKY